MSRIKTIATLGAFLLPFCAHAQFKVESLNSAARNSGQPDYQLPQLVGTPTDVAKRANLWLQYSLLGTVAGPNAASPFEKLDPHQGLVGLTYTVLAQTHAVLTMAFDSDYMGVYPSSGHSQQSLDLRSGRPIELSDLLSFDGLQRFNKRVAHERIAAVDHLLAHPDPARLQDGGEDAASQREQYGECRDTRILAASPPQDLALTRDSLTVTLDCEFPHVIQALDDLGSLAHTEPFTVLTPDLSTYGRCLLIEQRRDCVVGLGRPHAGAYQGLLGGKLAITLILVDDHLGGYEAAYFYDRYRSPIALMVKQATAHRLLLERRDDRHDSAVASETFDLAIAADGSLNGQWKQAGKPAIRVALH